MQILFFDTETTGLPLWRDPSDDPRQPYIVDLAADLVTETGETVKQIDFLIRNGCDIPEEVTALHGITREMAEAEGIEPRDALQQLMALIAEADLIVGHNVSFDIRMARIMAARVTGEKWDNPLPTFCTMRKSTNHCKILSNKPRHPEDWKWPNLGEAYLHFFGEEFENAHRARPDVDAARRIYFHLRSMEQ